MKSALALALVSLLGNTVFCQCDPPMLTIENLPQSVCIDSAPIPLLGYPTGGFFLINGTPVSFFEPSTLGEGNHAVTYFLVYDPTCPPINLTQIVSVKPALQIQVLDDTINCVNPYANLSAIGSGIIENYQWFGPNGFFSDLPSLDVNVTGAFYVIADNGGCIAEAEVVIYEDLMEPVSPSAVGGMIDCPTNSFTLNASSSTQNVFFEWIGPNGFSSTLQNPVVQEPGQYLVNITNPQNGCFVSLPVEVLAPIVPLVTTTASGVIKCASPSVSLSASSTSANVSFSWETPDGSIVQGQTISVSTPGLYIAQATDADGCVGTEHLTVEADTTRPQIDSIPNNTDLTCVSSSVTLSFETNAPNNTYSTVWIDQLMDTISTNSDIVVDQPGIYAVWVTDVGNGCSASLSFEVEIDTVAPIAIANIEQPLCEGTDGILTGEGSFAEGAAQFNWSSIDGNQVGNPDSLKAVIESSGTYLLTLTDGINGCQAVDTIEVSPALTFPAGLDLLISAPKCNGTDGAISFQNNSAANFTFNFQNTGFTNVSSYSGLDAGSYSIQIAAGTCLYDTLINLNSAVFSVILEAESTVADQGSEVAIQAIFNVPETEIDQTTWTISGNSICVGCFELMDTIIETTTYQIVAVTEDGCTTTDQLTIHARKNAGYYIGNAFSPNDDGINDLLVPYFGKSVKLVKSFQVFNRWGALVYETYNLLPQGNNTGWDGTIQGKEAPVDVYTFLLSIEYIDGRNAVEGGDVLLLK